MKQQDSSSFASPDALNDQTSYSVRLENSKSSTDSSGDLKKAVIFSYDSRDLGLSDEFKISNFLKNFLLSSVNYENSLYQDYIIPVFDKEGNYLSKSAIIKISQNNEELSGLNKLFEKIENEKSSMVSAVGSKISIDDLDFSYYSLAFIEDKSGKKDLYLMSFSRENVAENFDKFANLEIIREFDKNHLNLLKILNAVKSQSPENNPAKSTENPSGNSIEKGSVWLKIF
jgi:hypothetical protein